MKKKILIVHHGEGVGGGLIALIGLIEELKTDNDIHILAIFNSTAVDYLKKTGVNVTIAKSDFYSKYYRLFLHSEASYFSIVDSIRNCKNFATYFLSKYIFAKKEFESLGFVYDIVYLNSTFISDWSRASKLLGKKTVIHIREPLAKGLFGFRNWIIKKTISKYCDRVIAISQDNAKRIGLNNITKVIYDPVVHKNRTGKEELILLPDNKYFLYLGGMQRIKGFEQLVKSLPYINDNIKIFFLGGDHAHSNSRLDKVFLFLNPYLWRVKSLISKLKDSNRIIYIGLSNNIFDYYSKSIAVISPFSKPHASLPVLEAFSVGKPVIVSDVEGMDELVNKDNGILFKNNDSRALAEAINKLAQLELEKYMIMCQNAAYTYTEISTKNVSVQSIIDSL